MALGAWGRCAARASSASWRVWPCLDVEAAGRQPVCGQRTYICMFAYVSQRREAPWPGGGISGHPFLTAGALPRPPCASAPVRPRQHSRFRGARSSPHTHQPSGPPRVTWTPREENLARGGGLRSRRPGCPRWRNLPDLSDHQPGSPARLGDLTRSSHPNGGAGLIDTRSHQMAPNGT